MIIHTLGNRYYQCNIFFRLTENKFLRFVEFTIGMWKFTVEFKCLLTFNFTLNRS